MTKYIKTKKIFLKNFKFTSEQLKTVEEIASKHALIKVAEYLKISKNKFNNLRFTNQSLKEAVDRGLKIKGRYVPIYKSRTEKTDEYVKMAQASVNSQQREAVQRFRKEFAARKRERDLAELKDLDIL